MGILFRDSVFAAGHKKTQPTRRQLGDFVKNKDKLTSPAKVAQLYFWQVSWLARI
jgi:hypothetical protein